MNLLDDFKDGHIGLKDKRDEEILTLSLKQPSLFKIIIDRYEEAFLRKAKRIIGRQEEAEDIVLEAFSRIYMNARRFQPQEGATFKSWAYKILLNVTFTHYKKLKKIVMNTVELEPEFYEILPDMQSKEFDKETVRDYVASVLARVPDNLAQVLKRYFIDGVPQKEIADEEGVSVGAIKTRICRAKKEFKKANLIVS
ncbi:MAG: RNA polymerase sigma factor [Candidatus Vogelbacteria bacterium]|nr:RNA polymerase sigma factor [Candidatus Vogelbacteria bacterium]